MEACSRSGGEGHKRGKECNRFGIVTGISSMSNGGGLGVESQDPMD